MVAEASVVTRVPCPMLASILFGSLGRVRTAGRFHRQSVPLVSRAMADGTDSLLALPKFSRINSFSIRTVGCRIRPQTLDLFKNRVVKPDGVTQLHTAVRGLLLAEGHWAEVRFRGDLDRCDAASVFSYSPAFTPGYMRG